MTEQQLENRKAKQRQYYQNHKEEITNRTSAYKKKYPEIQRKSSRKHYYANLEKERARTLEYYTNQTSESRLRFRLKRYSMTPDQYRNLLEKQNYCCAICNRPESDHYAGKKLAIDHDHKCCPGIKSCGKCVRGLLCFSCNNGLGKFRESAELLHKASAYLESPSNG